MELFLYKDLGDPKLSPTPLVLVTRVNLYRAEVAGEENDARLVSLFRQFCLPTVLRQRRLPNAWYLLFDEEVRPPVASLLEDLAEYPWIKCRFPPRSPTNFRGGGPTDYLKQLIVSDFGDRGGIIVGRLDCDDALNRNYCLAMDASVDRHFQGSDERKPTFFNFTIGLINDRGESARFFANERSPFLFSFSAAADICLPIGFPHKAAAPIEIITEEPMWLYNLHGANVGRFTAERFVLTTPISEVETMFGVSLAIGRQA